MKVHELIDVLQRHAEPQAEVMTPDFGYGGNYRIHVSIESDELVVIESAWGYDEEEKNS